MPTVKPFLDTRYKSKDGTHQIIIRIRNGKDLRDIPTGYKVGEKEWKNEKVISRHPDERIINNRIKQFNQSLCRSHLPVAIFEFRNT